MILADCTCLHGSASDIHLTRNVSGFRIYNYQNEFYEIASDLIIQHAHQECMALYQLCIQQQSVYG